VHAHSGGWLLSMLNVTMAQRWSENPW